MEAEREKDDEKRAALMKKIAEDNAKAVAGFAKGIDDKTAAAAAA
jgi:predicted Rossmann fold nucleotide-binding protein DprA/Smf involved in DNA uptake